MTAEERQTLRSLIDRVKRERLLRQRTAQTATASQDAKGWRILTHSSAGYTRGCRCEQCLEGSRLYRRGYRARQRAQRL